MQVKAFVETVKRAGMENYEFAVYETRTYEIIENVRNFKSELGILYMNDMNRKVLEKILRENQLKFTELFSCDTYVYLRSRASVSRAGNTFDEGFRAVSVSGF